VVSFRVRVYLSGTERVTAHNTLGVTHGALARACHAAYEKG
jgi:hypothetical protein